MLVTPCMNQTSHYVFEILCVMVMLSESSCHVVIGMRNRSIPISCVRIWRKLGFVSCDRDIFRIEQRTVRKTTKGNKWFGVTLHCKTAAFACVLYTFICNNFVVDISMISVSLCVCLSVSLSLSLPVSVFISAWQLCHQKVM